MWPESISGTCFIHLYLAWIFIAVLVTHDSINKYSRVVSLNSKFGHWYYPLPSKAHTSVFGLFIVPRLTEQYRHALCILLLCLLLFLQYSTSMLLWTMTSFVSIVYFGQARTHGLIHNKADLVPLCLFIIGCSSNKVTACSNVRVLMACVYFSSGLMKLRKTGVRWMHGTNLQRMLLQFLCELRIEKPNFIQCVLIKSKFIATISQMMALWYEATFIIAVIAEKIMQPSSNILFVWFLYGLFGISFHSIIMYSLRIDFLRFWLPGLFSMVLPWLMSSDFADASGTSVGSMDPPICIIIACLFTFAHIKNHDGRMWPASSFDLYNKFYEHDTVEYTVLNLLLRDNNNNGDKIYEVPFDLSLCSSSGITRSYGWTSVKMNRNDKIYYLKEFLPKIIAQENQATYHSFIGVKELIMSVELMNDDEKHVFGTFCWSRNSRVVVKYKDTSNMLIVDWQNVKLCKIRK